MHFLLINICRQDCIYPSFIVELTRTSYIHFCVFFLAVCCKTVSDHSTHTTHDGKLECKDQYVPGEFGARHLWQKRKDDVN